jgi:hypothetical protein
VESSVYINTTTKTAHAGLTGSAAPSILAKLQARLQVDFYFFTPGEAAALLSSPTFRVTIKAVPGGAPFVYTSAAPTALTAGYRFVFDSVDAAALRTYLGSSVDAKKAYLEIEWTVAGQVERCATPLYIENAYIRSDESPPIPGEDERNQWFLDRLAALVTAGGYLEFQNTDGDWFRIGLNSGQAPS